MNRASVSKGDEQASYRPLKWRTPPSRVKGVWITDPKQANGAEIVSTTTLTLHAAAIASIATIPTNPADFTVTSVWP